MGFRAVDRPKVDSVLFRIASGMTGGEKNKMFAIGKKPRPAMGGVLRSIDHRCRGCRTTLRAHFHQRTLKIGSKHNHIVGAPASSARMESIGYGRNRAASGGDLQQLTAGIEA